MIHCAFIHDFSKYQENCEIDRHAIETLDSVLQGRRLNIPVVAKSPEEAAAHFGWLGVFAGLDCPASSAVTQERLGWRPVETTMLSDLERASNLES